ncbi:hypothetical protein SAMN04489740_1411 [Arthrobacter alpinus]|uniref:DNA-binding protein n=1 Tax=Arthrobacter alpinus TaxID=656366 RepID=A0A1H5IWM4_9MICC|nr:hypothetical protein [Arthrobacter alpinus]SEE43808.1 hypothetical protein SAMN04489740_1411 [Arthrobacter alpinus]
MTSPGTTEFPPSIGKPAMRALELAGFTRFDQLALVSAAELLRLHGIGPKSIRILQAELEQRGSGFAEPTP